MANFNKVILLGNLTRDVELRHTQSGQALAKFGMAINRRRSITFWSAQYCGMVQQSTFPTSTVT